MLQANIKNSHHDVPRLGKSANVEAEISGKTNQLDATIEIGMVGFDRFGSEEADKRHGHILLPAAGEGGAGLVDQVIPNPVVLFELPLGHIGRRNFFAQESPIE